MIKDRVYASVLQVKAMKICKENDAYLPKYPWYPRRYASEDEGSHEKKCKVEVDPKVVRLLAS